MKCVVLAVALLLMTAFSAQAEDEVRCRFLCAPEFLELDTSVAIFNWLPEGRWLRDVELEGSLDYVATALPRPGDRVDSVRFLDKASPWSFSVVFVLPLAPL